MRRDTLGGTAMIAGAIMELITMALHPTGHDVAREPGVQGALTLAVHALALVSVPIAFYGALILTRRLAQASELAELALTFYGASAVATMIAATASGFLAPWLIARAQTLEGAARDATEAVLRYNHGINQAFAQILVVASSVAIGIWSMEILRTRSMRRTSGAVGCLVAVITLAALFSGHVHLDVHGFGAIVLAQAVWLVLVGIELCSVGAKRASEPT